MLHSSTKYSHCGPRITLMSQPLRGLYGVHTLSLNDAVLWLPSLENLTLCSPSPAAAPHLSHLLHTLHQQILWLILKLGPEMPPLHHYCMGLSHHHLHLSAQQHFNLWPSC